MLPIFASLFAGAKTKTRLNSIKQVFWLIILMHGSIFLPISNYIYSNTASRMSLSLKSDDSCFSCCSYEIIIHETNDTN